MMVPLLGPVLRLRFPWVAYAGPAGQLRSAAIFRRLHLLPAQNPLKREKTVLAHKKKAKYCRHREQLD